jgi:hypothetical protein
MGREEMAVMEDGELRGGSRVERVVMCQSSLEGLIRTGDGSAGLFHGVDCWV